MISIIIIAIVLAITLPLVLLKKSSSNSNSNSNNNTITSNSISNNGLPTTTKNLIPLVPKLNYMYSVVQDPNNTDSNPLIFLNLNCTIPPKIIYHINICTLPSDGNTCLNNKSGYLINTKSPSVKIPIETATPSVINGSFNNITRVKAIITVAQNTSGIILSDYTEFIIPAFKDTPSNEWIQL
uniref:Uncharacterized protein n=1 Tax=viral metagenome TaxID=1070528 RepID=A0A6C0F3X3_9ZZZZ